MRMNMRNPPCTCLEPDAADHQGFIEAEYLTGHARIYFYSGGVMAVNE